MAFVKLIFKAYNLRNLTKDLEKEKRDSIQIERYEKVKLTFGQRIRHFRVDLRRGFIRLLKKILCPKRGSRLHKAIYNLQHDGSWENYILKSIVGFLCGFLLTYFLFLFCVITLRINFPSATILCIVLGCTLTLGLAFSKAVRCVTLLTLPQFFSKRGRKALIAYAFILTMSGPGQNYINNMGILNESLACGQELLKQAVRQIIDVIKKPFIAIRDALRTVVKTIKLVIKKIKEILIAIKRIIMAIVRVIKAAFLFLGKILNICNKELGTPYDRCIKVFEDAVLDCNAKLGPWFSWVCSITHLVKGVCFLVKPFDLVCMIVDFISNSIIGVIIKKIKQFVRHIKTMFYVKIKFSHSFKFQTNSSKTMKEVAHEMVAEIEDRTETLVKIYNFLTAASTFFFLYMIVQVIYYRFRFLTSERFDNLHITKDFHLVDIRRAGLGKETILPLSNKEQNIYIIMKSRKLVKTEKKSLKKNLSKLFVVTIKIGTFMGADYCLFWIMNMINYYGRFQSKVTAPNIPTLNIQGTGLLADLLKSIVCAFQPLGITLEIDTIPCLPTPIPPDYDTYIQIGFILLFSWILAVLEPYGLRLRQTVMVYYYPLRGKQRAIWLYNHILRNRSSFLKFARRQLRRKLLGTKNIEKITLKEYLRANLKSPIFRICLGRDKQDACLLCGEVIRESDTKKVYRCKTPNCPGIYCEECFRDLKNLCTVCMSPIDYGDISDIDEELDSSGDDEVVEKRKKLRKRKCKYCSYCKPKDDDEDYSTDEDYGDDHKLIKDLSDDEMPFDSDYNTGDSTDYSTSYQYEDKLPSEPIVPTISRSKDIEKQDIPDYVSMEVLRDDYLGRNENINIPEEAMQEQISDILADKKSSDSLQFQDQKRKISPKEDIDEIFEDSSFTDNIKEVPQEKPSNFVSKILSKFFHKKKIPTKKRSITTSTDDLIEWTNIPGHPEFDTVSSEENEYLTTISGADHPTVKPKSDFDKKKVCVRKDLSSSMESSSYDTIEYSQSSTKTSSETETSQRKTKRRRRHLKDSDKITEEESSTTTPSPSSRDHKIDFIGLQTNEKATKRPRKSAKRTEDKEPEKERLLTSSTESSSESTDSSPRRSKHKSVSRSSEQTTSYSSPYHMYYSTMSTSTGRTYSSCCLKHGKNCHHTEIANLQSRINKDINIPKLDLSFLHDNNIPSSNKITSCQCNLKSCKHDRFKYIRYNVESETTISSSTSTTSTSRSKNTDGSSNTNGEPSRPTSRRKGGEDSRRMFDPNYLGEPFDYNIFDKAQHKKVHGYYKSVNIFPNQPTMKKSHNFVDYLKSKFSRKSKTANRASGQEIELNLFDEEQQHPHLLSACTSPTYPFDQISERRLQDDPEEIKSRIEGDEENRKLLNSSDINLDTVPIGESTRYFSNLDYNCRDSCHQQQSYCYPVTFSKTLPIPNKGKKKRVKTPAKSNSEYLIQTKKQTRQRPEKPLDPGNKKTTAGVCPCDLNSENSSDLSVSYCARILGRPIKRTGFGSGSSKKSTASSAPNLSSKKSLTSGKKKISDNFLKNFDPNKLGFSDFKAGIGKQSSPLGLTGTGNLIHAPSAKKSKSVTLNVPPDPAIKPECECEDGECVCECECVNTPEKQVSKTGSTPGSECICCPSKSNSTPGTTTSTSHLNKDSTSSDSLEQKVIEACKRVFELSGNICVDSNMPLSRHCPDWDNCSCYCVDNSESKDDRLITDEALSRNSSAYIRYNTYEEISSNSDPNVCNVVCTEDCYNYPRTNKIPNDQYKYRSPNTVRNVDMHCQGQTSTLPCTYQSNMNNPKVDQCYCNCSYTSSGTNCQSDDYSCNCSDDQYSEVNFFDLPYQNNTEYMQLLQELECTLVNRNKERVQRTMREFEANSKLNKNLDKPIYDEDDCSSEPILQKMTYMKSNRSPPTCEPGCKCCNKINNQNTAMPTRTNRNRKEPPKNYVESVVRNMDPNPQDQLQKYPKFKKVVSTTRWQLDQKTGEWVKLTDNQGDSTYVKNMQSRPYKNMCCGCEICSNQRTYRGCNNKSKQCKCCYCTNRRPRK